MAEEIFFKEKNEKKFWKLWRDFTEETLAPPAYEKTLIEYEFAFLNKKKLKKDASFIYSVNNEIEACVFLPIEIRDDNTTITLNESYVDAPIIRNRPQNEKIIFSLIDEVAQKNNVSKIMFSVDPLETTRPDYNYLQKYGFLDTSILTYVIDLSGPDDY